jgi:hypothetical protein
MPLGEGEPWLATFWGLLVNQGADKAIIMAAVDRLANGVLGHVRRLGGMGLGRDPYWHGWA